MSAMPARAVVSFAAAVLVLFAAATFFAPPPASHPAEAKPTAHVSSSALESRLTLARHYLDTAQFIKARREYDLALRQAPRNPDVLAQFGWFMFEMGRTGEARHLITRALEIDPRSPDAQWCQANLLLYDQQNPRAALRVLRGLAARDDLSPDRRAEVTRLIAAAERALTTGRWAPR